MDIRLDGKRALVTGAGKGIGRAVCKKLVECGADTFALSRTKDDLDSLQNELPSVHVIHLDVTEWNRTREEITKIGPLDLLVNNAGVLTVAPFLETTKEVLDRIIDVNFKAAYNVAQTVAKGMVEKCNGGSVVNVSSIGSTKAGPGVSIYSSSKAALDMLTKSMALELGPNKIRVNSINPSVVWTPMTEAIAETVTNVWKVLEITPLGKYVEMDDVVNTVIFLLSDKSAMITGQCIAIDGGMCAH